MAATSQEKRGRRRGRETRQLLIKAAQAVFARQGYDRATVDAIVREAGFSKGAFYVHFQGKEDLFWEMLEERISRQQEAFRQAVDPSRPTDHNVRTILANVFALVREDAQWRAMFMEFGAHAMRNDRVRQRLGEMYRRWRTLIEETLRTAQETGQVRRDIDIGFMASVLMAAVEGSIMQACMAPDSVRLDELAEPLSRTLAEWLSPR